MAKSQSADALREHYNKKYRARIDEAKAAEKKAWAKASELAAENRRLKRKVEADAETIRLQDMLISELQSRLDMTDGELSAFKKSLDAIHEAAAASRAANAVASVLAGAMGDIGVLPKYLEGGEPDDGEAAQ